MRTVIPFERAVEQTFLDIAAEANRPLGPSPPSYAPSDHVRVLKEALEKLRRLLPRLPKPKAVRPRRLTPRPEAPFVPRPMDDVAIPREHGQLQQEIAGCKMLLLEVVRRAAYDWVLYRQSRKLENKCLAEEAYTWLFLEGPAHPDWLLRTREDKHLMSFESICLHLDLEPDLVRSYIKKMEPKNVMSVGRPAEYRKGDGSTPETLSLSVSGYLVDEAFSEQAGFEDDH